MIIRSTFPYEKVPDGVILAPHHLTIGALIGLYFCAIVWDNYRYRQPHVVGGSLLSVIFSFISIWPYYPVLGAVLTLLSLLAATIAVMVRSIWYEYPLKYRQGVATAIIIAWDDALSHTFGVQTPLDWLFLNIIFPLIVELHKFVWAL